MKYSKIIRPKTQISMIIKPFQQSLITIIIENCQKCLSQISKGNLKKAEQHLNSTLKDLRIAEHCKNFTRLKSLYLNTKSLLARKKGQVQNSMNIINELVVYTQQNNMHPAQKARAILHKCIILQNLYANNNLFGSGQIIRLVKQALDLLSQCASGQKISSNTKLNQIMMLNFYSAANELLVMKSQDEAQQLMKRAYKLSIKTLGSIHQLSILLKKSLKTEAHVKNKQQINKSYQKTMGQSQNIFGAFKQQFQNKKIKQKSNRQTIWRVSRVKTQPQSKLKFLQAKQMKQLQKIKKLYKPTTVKLPIRDIIMKGNNTSYPRNQIKKTENNSQFRKSNQYDLRSIIKSIDTSKSDQVCTLI